MTAKVWAVVDLVSLHGFFLPQMASIMISLAVALPHRSCSLHVTEWFMRAGVVFTLTSYLDQLQGEVEHAAGGILKAELLLINCLKLIKVLLFIFELGEFWVILLCLLVYLLLATRSVHIGHRGKKSGHKSARVCSKTRMRGGMCS